MKIETERLVIRDFQKRDVVGLLEYLSNPRVELLCRRPPLF